MGELMFKVGDVVELTQGGLPMTVDDMGNGCPRPDGAISCVWFDFAGELHRDAFLPGTLRAGMPLRHDGHQKDLGG